MNRREKATKVRQACDGCRVRKIRCNGCWPCANCHESSDACTFFAVPKKTGPKGRRRPRPTRSGPSYPCLSTSLAHPSSPSASNQTKSSSSWQSPLLVPRLSLPLMRSCLDAFFTQKYPITPIIDRIQVESALPTLENDPEMYGLVTAVCAVMVLSPEVTSDVTPDFLVSETIRARSLCDTVERPSLTTVQTSFFLFSAFFCLGRDNSAWHYIREAITTLQCLGLHQEATYADLDDGTALYSRRMFWVLFITERAYALQRHHPLTIQDTIQLPAADSGLLDLISLFGNFDSQFLTMWNVSNGASPLADEKRHMVQLQQALDVALPRVSDRTATQQADLLLSREWLKLMTWQLCVSKMVLSSTSVYESMSLAFPVTVARNVVATTHALPDAALQANGVGILEKMFDVGCSLADVLALRRLPNTRMDVGPAEHLCEILRLVGSAGGGSPRHVAVLAVKVDQALEQALQSVTCGEPRVEEELEESDASP